jgi:DNA polymerase zeta
MIFEEEWLYRVSPEGSKTLEFDVHVADILNRHSVEPRNLHHDFTEFLHHPIPLDAKLVYSVKGVWEDERQRRLARGESGPSEEEPSSFERKYKAGEQPKWASSDRFNVIFQDMLENDKARYMATHQGKWPPTFESFVKHAPQEPFIPTTFESVASLFPNTFIQDELEANPFGAWAVRGMGVSFRAKTEDIMDEETIAKLASQINSGPDMDDWDDQREMPTNEEDLQRILDEDQRRARNDENSDAEDQEAQAIEEEAINQLQLEERQDTVDIEDRLEGLQSFPSSFQSSRSSTEEPVSVNGGAEDTIMELAEEQDDGDPDAAYLKETNYGLGSLTCVLCSGRVLAHFYQPHQFQH